MRDKVWRRGLAGRSLAPLLLLVSLFAAGAQAQENVDEPGDSAAQATAPEDGQNASTPQTEGAEATPKESGDRMARLSLISGAVRVQRIDNTVDDPAVLNMPLTEGTRVVTGEDGRAEIEFEDGSLARLVPRTTVTLDAMGLSEGDARTELSLVVGLAYFELRVAPGFSYRVTAGEVTATPQENAVVRVGLDQPGGRAAFALMSGSAEISAGEAFKAHVSAGETLQADPSETAGYRLSGQIATESTDEWNQTRDQIAAGDAGSRTRAREGFAGAQGFGWSDLDVNGTWYAAPAEDGSATEIWQPNVADVTDEGDDANTAFDPYGYGNFVWTGTTYFFASGYAWGWTPYRCGHWDWYPGLGWAWRPNRFCFAWGFGGAGGILLGTRPPNYKAIHIPVRRSGKPHPIAVLRPAQPKREEQHAELIKVHGVALLPMPVEPPVIAPGVLGQALYRDFPVTGSTRTPLFGVVTHGEAPTTPVGVLRTLPPRPVFGGAAGGEGLSGVRRLPPAPVQGRLPVLVQPPRPGAPVGRPEPRVPPRTAPVAPAPPAGKPK